MAELVMPLTPWSWLIIAGLLLIVEVFGTAGYFLWFGLSAALVAALLAVLPMAWTWQLVCFASLALATGIGWWYRLKQKPATASSLNNPGKSYLGREVILHEAIVSGRGKIKLNDGFWLVEGPDLAAGQMVKIIGQEGVIFKVEPLNA